MDSRRRPGKHHASSYGRPLVEASRAGLLELAVSLGSYREALVLVGGWVPYFLLKQYQAPDKKFNHIGSIDIDFVVDPDKVGAEEYATIVEIIGGRGWEPSGQSPFSYIKKVLSPVDRKPYDIQVDFLTPEPERLAGKHRHRDVQPDLKARTMPGAPIALAHHYQIQLEGSLPEGGYVRPRVLMADVVGCVGMKGLVLGSRYAEKDAYDLYSVLENCASGPRGVAAAVKPHIQEPLLAESLGHIREMFASREAAGPVWVANFLTEQRDEAHRRLVVRAFMIVSRFLEDLG